MATPTIKEKFIGLQGYSLGTSGGAIEVPFLVTGFTDETVASDYAIANAPQTRGALKLESITRLTPIDPDNGLWDVFIRYVAGDRGALAFGQSAFSFRIGGSTQRIRNSLETVHQHSDPANKNVDHNKAIGVTPDGNVEGADIIAPSFEWSETWVFPKSQVNLAFVAQIYALSGRTNNAAFRVCATGECLFNGCEGSARDLLSQTNASNQVEVTFNFSASPNKTGITLGNITTDKGGWEYLWVEYSQTEDSAASRLGAKAIQANVERVYESGNFALLGIGT